MYTCSLRYLNINFCHFVQTQQFCNGFIIYNYKYLYNTSILVYNVFFSVQV